MANKRSATPWSRVTAALCLLIGLSLLGPLVNVGHSQSSTATLEGILTDETGGVLPGASVRIANAQTGLTRAVTTDEKGYYRIALLPVGEYAVVPEMPGFAPFRPRDIQLTVGQILRLDMSLAAAATTELTVTPTRPAVETSRTQFSTTVEKTAIANLPVNGRNFIDFVLLTPGVTRDPRTGDLSFGGQRGTLNSIQIDGADNNNTFFGQPLGRTGSGPAPYQFSQDAVREFQVNTNSYSSEYGRAGGGVINVVTKSGTNEFHGSVFDFYRDKSLNANTWMNNQTGKPKSPYHFNQFGGNLGGPLIKKTLFFFFDYDGQRNRRTQVINPGGAFTADTLPEVLRARAFPYNLTFNSDVYFLKIDWQASDRHRLTGRYNHQGFQGANLERFSPASTFEHTGDSFVKTDTLALALNTTLTPRVLNELRAQIGRDAEPGTAHSDQPEAVIREGQAAFWIGRNSFGPRDTRLRKYQVLDNLSVLRGQHNWKFGMDVNVDRITNYAPSFFGGSYVFNSIAAFLNNQASSYTQAFAGPDTSGARTAPNSTDVSWFVNDNLRVGPRLTLNLGLRYDVQILAQPSLLNPDPQLAAAGIRTDRAPIDKNNFGPRLGFAWRPRDTDLFVVRGGYGIYYGRTPAMLLAQAHAQNGLNVRTITWMADRATLPMYPNRFDTPPAGGVASSNLYFFHPDFRSAYVQQGNLGVERGLGDSMSVSASYLFTKGTHLTRTTDINLFPPVPARIDVAGGGQVFYLRYPDGRPYDRFGWLNQFTSNANSVYHGLALQWTRRFQSYQFLASYTLSKAIDDVPDATAALAGSPGDNIKFVQYTLLPRLDRGLSSTDQRHRFVLSGVWDPNSLPGLSATRLRGILKGWSLAWILTAASGRPYSAFVQGDLNNDDNSFNDRAPQEGRNIYTSPKFISLDPRATWQIPLHENLRLHLIVEAFNVFNRANFGPFSETGVAVNSIKYVLDPARTLLTPRPDFGRPRDTFDPRIIQLAVKLTF